MFHLNDIWLALAFMFIPAKKRRNSPSKVKDFVFKLYAALKHQFGPQCLDGEITRFYIISNTFFSSALVVLNISMNWLSSVVWVLLTTCRYLAGTFFIFSILLSYLWIYLCLSIWLIFIIIDQIISLKQTHLILCTFLRICRVIFSQ